MGGWMLVGATLSIYGFIVGLVGRNLEKRGKAALPPKARAGVAALDLQDEAFVRYWRRTIALGWLGIVILVAIGVSWLI